MNTALITAGVSVIVAIIGLIRLIIKSKTDTPASLLKLINYENEQKNKKIAEGIVLAQQEAERHKKAMEKIAVGELSDDIVNNILSGKDAENSK